jgi:catechol 2,3-dioxygenase-like lactoylglutathione lyase family enzyme
MPARFTHVVVKVADLDRSIAFYRAFCDLEVVRDGRPDGHTVWLAPVRRPPGPPPFVLVLYLTEIDFHLDHLGFQVDRREEVDRIAADAARAGALVEGPIDGGGDIGYLAMLRDPDGHRVEFTCGQPIGGVGG